MLNKATICQFDPCSASLEDLHLFLAQLEPLFPLGYEWLTEKLDAVKAEYAVRTRAEKLRALKQMKLQRETLLSATEKRAKLEAEINAMERTLNESA